MSVVPGTPREEIAKGGSPAERSRLGAHVVSQRRPRPRGLAILPAPSGRDPPCVAPGGTPGRAQSLPVLGRGALIRPSTIPDKEQKTRPQARL